MSVWPLPRITFRELSSVEESRPVALLTTDAVWAVLSTQLALPILIQAEPSRYDQDLFASLAVHLPSRVEAVYVAGTGPLVAAGKYVAAHNAVPLVFVPTALDSVDIFSPIAQVDHVIDNRRLRGDDETGPAAEVIIDWGVIESAPESLRGAGIVDVLSVVCGLLDWRYAAQKGKNPREQRFVPWAASVVTGLVKEAIKSSAAIGQGRPEALETLLDLMMLAVQVSNQLGHTRAQQGSEHYLARMLASTTNPTQPHAELVGPSLLFASALHGQDPAALRDALQNAGVRLDQVRSTDFNLLLDNLAAYLAVYDLPYSILNDLDTDSEQVAQALDSAGLAIQAETWDLPGDTEPLTAGVPLEVRGLPPIEAPHESKETPGAAQPYAPLGETQAGLPEPEDEAAPPTDDDLLDWLSG